MSELSNDLVIATYRFNLNYLKRLCENISEEKLFEKQLDGFNSAGWILGHIAVEAEDVIQHLAIDAPPVPQQWVKWFRVGSGKVNSLEGLPTKIELLSLMEARYEALAKAYSTLTDEQKSGPHPSQFLKSVYTNLDQWYAHHLTSHIAIHCGNLVVWKKLIGLEVGGY